MNIAIKIVPRKILFKAQRLQEIFHLRKLDLLTKIINFYIASGCNDFLVNESTLFAKYRP